MLEKLAGKIRWVLTAMGTYLSLTGLVFFSLFILEESVQCCQFSTWGASDAGDWATVKIACDQMERINKLLKGINTYCGLIQPLGYLSYKAYGESADIYIRATRAKAFAKAPELFVGEEISLTFVPASCRPRGDGTFELSNGRITVIGQRERRAGFHFELTGIVSMQDAKIFITEKE